jgi:hypothetical protein
MTGHKFRPVRGVVFVTDARITHIPPTIDSPNARPKLHVFPAFKLGAYTNFGIEIVIGYTWFGLHLKSHPLFAHERREAR